MTPHVKQELLNSSEPIPPSGTVYNVVGIHASEVVMRSTEEVLAEGARRGYLKPQKRLSLLLAEIFTKEGGPGWGYNAIMHEPIPDGKWTTGEAKHEIFTLTENPRVTIGSRLAATEPGAGFWNTNGVFMFLAPNEP